MEKNVQNEEGLPSLTIINSPYSPSFKDRPASTSKLELVTPPLLVEASLKSTTPFFSNHNLACCVKNKLAPSMTYLKCGFPSPSTRLATLLTLTASGRPPHGTNRSALTRKWNELRNSVPSGIISPEGS